YCGHEIDQQHHTHAHEGDSDEGKHGSHRCSGFLPNKRPGPAPGSAHRPITKSASSFRLSATMIRATTVAIAVSQRGAASSPILRRLAVKTTSGITAKGNCKLNITCEKMSSFAVPLSP